MNENRNGHENEITSPPADEKRQQLPVDTETVAGNPDGDSPETARNPPGEPQSGGKTTEERPDATQSVINRRKYSLWELIRHRDYDTIVPETVDPNTQVLSDMRPSAWDR